jgi:hypothetical protein
MLAAPVLSFTGCGGNEGPGSPAPIGPSDSAVPAAGPPVSPSNASASQLKPAFVYYSYSSADASQPQAVEAQLPLVANNVTPTADRFAQGALCYEFNGRDSSIAVAPFTGFPQGDFALMLWVRSTSPRQIEALRITGTDGGTVVIEVNGLGLTSVRWNGYAVSMTIPDGELLPPMQGSWHHLAVQRYASELQLFLDGALLGEGSVSAPLPANPSVLIGGGWQGAIDTVRLYNRAFPTSSIPQAVYAWTQVKAPLLNTNMEGFYPFNGNADNALAYEGGDGTPYNVTLTADRFGTPDTAYLFNGVDAYIAVLDDPVASTAADFAISFWEQSTSQTAMAAISVTPGGVSLDIVFNAGAGIAVMLAGAPVPSLSYGAVGSLTDGQWHYVLLQRVGSNFQLYIDGVQQAEAQNDAVIFGGNATVQMGKGSASSTLAVVNSFWNGALDDIGIFDTSLTAAQMPGVQQLQFLPRDGAGALTFQGKMWLLGGWNPVDNPVCNNQVWSSTDGVNWVLVTNAPWEGRHDAGYAVFNDKLWIVGGDKNTGHYQNDVWSSADGVNWELVTKTVPWANRATQYVLEFNNRLWLMGGQQIFESTLPVVAYNDVYSSADGITWQLETAQAGWSPRGLIMGSAVFRERMWVIGGGTYDVKTYNNDVWSSADGIHWHLVLAGAPWAPRIFHNIATFDNKLWVLAGGDPSPASIAGLSDVWYSNSGVTWTQLPGTPWVPRHAASTFVFDNQLWIAAGSDASVFNDVWRLGYAP